LNELFSLLELQAWKPLLTALLLPPAPLLVTVLLGAALMPRRPRTGWYLVVGSVALVWASCSTQVADRLQMAFGLKAKPLAAERIRGIAEALERDPDLRLRTAVLVLGGGRESFAPEYQGPSLSDTSLQRLRHGLWLGRSTGAAVGFSGGSGWAQQGMQAEADVAARIAAQEFGQNLRWVESQSRDTRENAQRALAMLHADGVAHVLLVTNGWHMRRALRAFEAQAGPGGARIEAAPMGLAAPQERGLLGWIPSAEGLKHTRAVLREQLGWWFGA
jgi:uncharacterized SAM-binding protein YcdF (DUF218 family)